MSAALQQGNADGMCGLYALLNFLRSKRSSWQDDGASDCLWCLLDACEHFGWFTPHYLTRGFEDFQLKEILDLLIERYRLPFKSYRVGDVVASREFQKFGQLVDAVLVKGGSIVASHDARDHWLLVQKRNGSPTVIDSANSKIPTSDFKPRIRSFSLELGVVILPFHRPQIEIEL